MARTRRGSRGTARRVFKNIPYGQAHIYATFNNTIVSMHIAAATGTPVISIFGPSNFRAWHPWAVGGRASVLTSQVECSPCSYVGHSVGARDGCEARTCMKMVTSQRVISTAHRILNDLPRKLDETPDITDFTAQTVPVPRTKVLGVPVDAITYAQWMKQIHGLA